jgi:hypothetical protein
LRPVVEEDKHLFMPRTLTVTSNEDAELHAEVAEEGQKENIQQVEVYYPRETPFVCFKLTVMYHDVKLVYSAIAFLVFWLAGSAIFVTTEGWGYGSAMYFCEPRSGPSTLHLTNGNCTGSGWPKVSSRSPPLAMATWLQRLPLAEPFSLSGPSSVSLAYLSSSVWV